MHIKKGIKMCVTKLTKFDKTAQSRGFLHTHTHTHTQIVYC